MFSGPIDALANNGTTTVAQKPQRLILSIFPPNSCAVAAPAG